MRSPVLRKRWVVVVLSMALGAVLALALGARALDWIFAAAQRRDAAAEIRSEVALKQRAAEAPLDGEGAAALSEAIAASAIAATAPEGARAAFAPAAALLLQAPDPEIRAALLASARPETRDAGLEALAVAADAVGGGSAAALHRARGALLAEREPAEAIGALDRALALHPQDIASWRLLGALHAVEGRKAQSLAAGRVAAGLEHAAAGNLIEAEADWEQALPQLKPRAARAFVLGQLGDAAGERRDFAAAETRYREALRLSTSAKDLGAISVDASKLARAQLAQGRAQSACRTLQTAEKGGAVVSSAELAAACPAAPGLRGLTGQGAPGASR